MGTSIRELEDTYFRWLRRTDEQLLVAFDAHDRVAVWAVLLASLHVSEGWHVFPWLRLDHLVIGRQLTPCEPEDPSGSAGTSLTGTDTSLCG